MYVSVDVCRFRLARSEAGSIQKRGHIHSNALLYRRHSEKLLNKMLDTSMANNLCEFLAAKMNHRGESTYCEINYRVLHCEPSRPFPKLFLFINKHECDYEVSQPETTSGLRCYSFSFR